MAITATPKTIRPHLEVAELQDPSGGRYWSAPMPESVLGQWVRNNAVHGTTVSEISCATKCWCAQA